MPVSLYVASLLSKTLTVLRKFSVLVSNIFLLLLYYLRKSMVEFEPRLVALTCLYLASKAEESIVQARNLVFYIKRLYPDEYNKYELKDILGMEMKVLEALDYYLVVFHPYRSLSEYVHSSLLSAFRKL